MLRRDPCAFILTAFLLIFHCGCGRPVEKKPVPLSQAEEEFLKICRDELNIPAVTKNLGHSFWVYAPMNGRIFDIKATEKTPPEAATAKVKQNIYYLDVRFEDNNFRVDYDIGLNKSYPADPGYGYSYPAQFQSTQQNLLTAVRRSFGEAENAPEFFVIVFADIEKGIEIRNIIYLPDLLRAYIDQGFSEEYARRSVSLAPKGDQAIVGDAQGRHVDFHDITWEEFLAAQIKYRIQFKYTRSAFAPGDDALAELTAQIKETFKAYGFRDFDGVTLTNLATGSHTSLIQADLF